MVKIRVAGIFSGLPMNELLEERYQAGDTPAALLGRLDKRKAVQRRFFSKVVKSGNGIFLLNGNRLELNDLKQKQLADGDEISVLSAIAGG
ncbi:MAG: hypothetical protein C4520_18175 [Candidatus Abyssobacteria bacterium SURF_5]|uniref:MoaD/ThiS family protein n=1 Tax=Abyssobacteria bacterium (strain SURF_5) TaxID=2093360 RepID=A0A3A4NDA2_ABYX5|nr:MAG: hypothetical protein C4520_18175 [Candidatus Abyssubacteria bacterium SURF_5]